MKRHPAFEEMCTVAERHRLHVLLFASDHLAGTHPKAGFRLLESVAVVAPGSTDPIVGGLLGGQLDGTSARLLIQLRRILKEIA